MKTKAKKISGSRFQKRDGRMEPRSFMTLGDVQIVQGEWGSYEARRVTFDDDTSCLMSLLYIESPAFDRYWQAAD